MAHFNYTVDTRPMAEEISTVSNHLSATTGAVVAMQAAVIMAEQKAADQVCENVNEGFYTLMRSQISQKMARLRSEVDSYEMQLSQQRKALVAIKERMGRDYRRITDRYVKLFGGLNANLQQRVYELDKPVFDLTRKELQRIGNRTRNLPATVPIGQSEMVTTGQLIINSGMKHRGAAAIWGMKRFLTELAAQRKLTDLILIQERNGGDAVLGLPVLIYERVLSVGSSDLGIQVPSFIARVPAATIANAAATQANTLQWRPADRSGQLITEAFMIAAAAAPLADRVRRTVLALFAANDFETLPTNA